MACTSHAMLENTRLSIMFSHACIFRLVEEKRVAIIAVVHVDDIFAV